MLGLGGCGVTKNQIAEAKFNQVVATSSGFSKRMLALPKMALEKAVMMLTKRWNPNTEEPGYSKFYVESIKRVVQTEAVGVGGGWASLNPSIHFIRDAQGNLQQAEINFDTTNAMTDSDAGRLSFLENILKTIAKPTE